MPEEISSEPSVQKVVAANPEPYGGKEEKLSKLDFLTVQGIFEKVVAAQQAKYKDKPGASRKIQLVANVLYSVFRLQEGATNTDSDTQKEISARIIKPFIHNTYYASTDESPEDFSQTMYKVVRVMEILARHGSKSGSTSVVTSPFWSGIKNELSVVKAIKEGANWDLFIPNYDQKETVREEFNEVLQMDVKGGIDLFTIVANNKGEDVALLLDITGNRSVQEIELFRQKTTGVYVPKVLSTWLKNEGIRIVRHANVRVPSVQLDYPVDFPLEKSPHAKDELRRFAQLNMASQAKLLDDITNLVNRV